VKPCPLCTEEIQDEAIRCRFCGAWLIAGSAAAATPAWAQHVRPRVSKVAQSFASQKLCGSPRIDTLQAAEFETRELRATCCGGIV